MLISVPILKIVDPNKEYVVCTNACKEGIGGVLMYEGHIIYYESTKLKEHEKNYETHDLELESILHALNMWMDYLIGRRFEIRIDHMNLKCLFY